MDKKEVTVIWSKAASEHFTDILNYLGKESEQAAEIVGNAILNSIETLPSMPYKFPADRFKRPKDNHFRAITIFSYRISYCISENEIIILRIRHTSREPLEY